MGKRGRRANNYSQDIQEEDETDIEYIVNSSLPHTYIIQETDDKMMDLWLGYSDICYELQNIGPSYIRLYIENYQKYTGLPTNSSKDSSKDSIYNSYLGDVLELLIDEEYKLQENPEISDSDFEKISTQSQDTQSEDGEVSQILRNYPSIFRSMKYQLAQTIQKYSI